MNVDREKLTSWLGCLNKKKGVEIPRGAGPAENHIGLSSFNILEEPHVI